MVLYDHDDKSDKGNAVVSWNRNILKTAAINAVIAAQMAVVKILTWTSNVYIYKVEIPLYFY
jgi:hypothetical protein